MHIFFNLKVSHNKMIFFSAHSEMKLRLTSENCYLKNIFQIGYLIKKCHLALCDMLGVLYCKTNKWCPKVHIKN